jgi:IS5 family transposase
MKQADRGLELFATRKRQILDEMERVVPRSELIDLIEPHYTEKDSVGRPPFTLSDPTQEEAPFEVLLFREYAQSPTGKWFPAMPR